MMDSRVASLSMTLQRFSERLLIAWIVAFSFAASWLIALGTGEKGAGVEDTNGMSGRLIFSVGDRGLVPSSL